MNVEVIKYIEADRVILRHNDVDKEVELMHRVETLSVNVANVDWQLEGDVYVAEVTHEKFKDTSLMVISPEARFANVAEISRYVILAEQRGTSIRFVALQGKPEQTVTFIVNLK